MLTVPSRVFLFAVGIFVLGGLVTLVSGEMASDPWLVLVDVGQVAAAALVGAFALPFAVRVREPVRPTAR
jgi:hypothetical protein